MADWNPRFIPLRSLNEAEAEIARTGAEPVSAALMARKALLLPVRLDDVPCPAANILKQEMLAVGGDAAVSRGVIDCSVPSTGVLLLGTVRQYELLSKKLDGQPFGLADLAASIGGIVQWAAARQRTRWKCRGRDITLGEKTVIMGILNVTPDSFSDGGRFAGAGAAVEQARRMAAEGADIIDVGGESTRPGSDPVDAETELKRVLPVVERLVKELDLPVSVDTSKAVVAERCLAAGAAIINDVTALGGTGMAEVAASSGTGVVLMHMKGTPKTMQAAPSYEDATGEVVRFLRERTAAAVSAGMAPESVVVDPGIGFGKRPLDNLELISRLGALRSIGRPVLVGLSRKSLLAGTANLPPQERLEGTLSANAVAVLLGADIIRVHDVKAAVRGAEVARALSG